MLRLVVGGQDVTGLVEGTLTYSNVDPGGFEVCSFELADPPAGVARGQPVRVEWGTEVAWQGRVSEVGRAVSGRRGDRRSVSCEGAGAVLKDNLMAEIYRDADLSHWGEPSAQRRLNLAAGYRLQWSSSVGGQDTGAARPSIVHATDQINVTVTISSRVESWYDGGSGVPLDRLVYDFDNVANINAADAGWTNQAFLSTDDLATGLDAGTDHNGTDATDQTLAATDDDRTYAILIDEYAAASTGNFTGHWEAHWRPVVYGRHGLTVRGSEPDAGFWPSDLAADAARRAGGLDVRVRDGPAEVTVGQAEYRTAVQHERVVADAGRLAGWHWGTWEPASFHGRPTFLFQPRPPTATVVASVESFEGSLDLTEQLSDLYDRALVAYQDKAGQARTVEVELASDELDGLVAGGRTLELNLGAGAEETAEAYGRFGLLISQRDARATGSGTLRGAARDQAGGERPVALLKAGRDRVLVPDLPDQPVFTGRRDFHLKRVEVTVSSEGASARLDLGVGAALAEVLQARIEQKVGELNL